MTIVAADRPSVAVPRGAVGDGHSPLELFAAAVALVLPVAFVTNLDAPAWSLRAAILLVVAAVGLPVLLSQTRGPRALAARAAVTFLLVGTASATLSANPTTAVLGLYNQGTGLLFMASLAGAWAIGRRIRPEARPLLERALIFGILVNVGVVLLASVVNLSSVSPDLVDASGRPSGLAGNSVHLAALAVLGLALLVPRFVSSPARWALPVAAVAAATQLSGTRGALVVMIGIAAWAGRRHGLRVAAGLALLLVLGIAAGSALGTSSTATARAGQLGSLSNRPATWLSAWPSLVQHTLLGVGPGQFRTATSPHRPLSVGISEGSEQLFTDAHNIFVEYATTTGVLGLGALLVWLFAAVRSARGWLLVGALGLLVIHLFEPQSVVTTPLAFLALGAAASSAPERQTDGPRPWHRVIPACLVGVAVVAAVMFLYGEFQAHQAQLDLQTGPARQAERVLPAWPRTASLSAQVSLFQGITNLHNQADYQTSRTWRLVAVHRDDTDPGLWLDLAEFDESLGRTADAQAEFASALRFNPTSVRAMDGLARLAQGRCDAAQASYWSQRAARIAPPDPSLPRPARPPVQPIASSCAVQP